MSMLAELQPTTIYMLAAVLFGSIVGMERQARNRLAGVRTNALVALGAASFVIFSGLFPGDSSPTRVAAQIVSGIGFLGAGIIFRDGLNVLGLNTAATLWCSAAVGMFCGAGNILLAATLTGVLLLVNLFLRPIINLFDRLVLRGRQPHLAFQVTVVGPEDRHEDLRLSLLAHLRTASVGLNAIDAHHRADGVVELVASVNAPQVALEQVVALLAADPAVRRADWKSLNEY